MYLHVTTRIDNQPDDNLFRELGFTGFPSLGFMDAKGQLVAKHAGSRTIAGFDGTAKSAAKYIALRKQAADGDKAASQHLFVHDLALGRYKFTDGSLAFAGNRKGMAKELRQRAKQHLIDLQYNELTRALRSAGTADRQAYAKKYLELQLQFFHAGRIPSGYRAGSVYGSVLRHAQAQKNAKLFAKALDGYKSIYGNQPRYARMIERYTKQLAELQQ